MKLILPTLDDSPMFYHQDVREQGARPVRCRLAIRKESKNGVENSFPSADEQRVCVVG